MPAAVDTIKIYLPNEDVVVIHSQSRIDKLKAGPSVPNEEVTVQVENVQLGPGVLDAVGEAIKARGFRGRLIIGKDRKGQLFLCHKRYINRPVTMGVEPEVGVRRILLTGRAKSKGIWKESYCHAERVLYLSGRYTIRGHVGTMGLSVNKIRLTPLFPLFSWACRPSHRLFSRLLYTPSAALMLAGEGADQAQAPSACIRERSVHFYIGGKRRHGPIRAS